MSKKLILVLCVLVLAIAAAGFTAYDSQERKSVQIRQEIAGSIFAGIEVTETTDFTTVNRTLLNLYAKGAPGEAHIEVVGGALPVPPNPPSGLCEDGAVMEFTFVDGGFVETFNDHSMLFYVIDDSPGAENALCIYADRPAEGTFDYRIIGGAGRFEGATGSARVKIESWFVTNELTAETGTIRGSLQLP